MKICRVCLSSGILCSGCSMKLEEGKINATEIELSRTLHKLNQKAETDFFYAMEEGGKIFVVVESKHAAGFIGPGGRNIKKLAALLGKPVKLLEKSEGSERQVLEKLLGAPVLGINKTFPQESYRVRMEKRFAKHAAPVAGIVGKVMGKKVSFVFE